MRNTPIRSFVSSHLSTITLLAFVPFIGDNGATTQAAQGVGSDCYVRVRVDGGPSSGPYVALGETTEWSVSAERDAPTVNQECVIDTPTFNWSVRVDYQEDSGSPPVPSSYVPDITPGPPGDPRAEIRAVFPEAGVWRIFVKVSATWHGHSVNPGCGSCPDCGDCTAVSDEFALADIKGLSATVSPTSIKVGYTADGSTIATLTKRLTITVKPKGELANFTIDQETLPGGTGEVELTEISRAANVLAGGTIKIDVAGKAKSNAAAGDVEIKVTHSAKPAAVLAKSKAVVIVPAKLDTTGLDVKNKKVKYQRFVFYPDKSPADAGLRMNQVKFAEGVILTQPIGVNDQFGDALDKMYNGALVTEVFPTGTFPIYQTVQNGKYNDPIGLFRRGTPQVIDYPAGDDPPMPDQRNLDLSAWAESQPTNLGVRVAGHSLTPDLKRQVSVTKKADTTDAYMTIEYDR